MVHGVDADAVDAQPDFKQQQHGMGWSLRIRVFVFICV
jgi:hypothetical protein